MTVTLGDLPPTATPPDYLRLKFDPSNVPAKRIVGLLACQRDPLLQHLTTRVTSARPAPILAVPAQKGKGLKKKDKSASGSSSGTPAESGAATPIGTDTPNGSGNGEGSGLGSGRLWEVELEDTVIFPEGGGQPSDTGYLTLTDPNGGEKKFRVEMCIRRKLDSVHLVRVSEGDEGLWHAAGEVGAEVRIEVDWERRVDQMTLHTAQHLLSAVLDTYELPTLSWAMHAHPSLETPYVELQRQLTWREAEEVEGKCNALIAQAKKIWIEVSIQGQDAGGEDSERESRGLPKDYAGGVVRHCCIDQTDRNACCGTQLPHLGMCTYIHVIPPSLASDSDKPSTSATKLFFTAGPRAMRYLAESSRRLSLTSQALGAARNNAAERAVRTEELRKEAGSTNDALRKEVARMVADQAVRESAGKGVVWVHRDQKGTHDFEFLGSVAMGVMMSPGWTDVREGKGVVVLTSAVEGVAGGLLLVQSKDDATAKEVKEKVSAAIDAVAADGMSGKRVRGGGAKGRYMSKIEGKQGKREKEAIGMVIQELQESG